MKNTKLIASLLDKKSCFYFQGKSLSLICGALRWLKDFQKHQSETLEADLKQYEV